ncbi:M23 family metallopeptidase [Streptomyces sp. NPDC048002]|uniref:M23 family metallopeptidase n=1 Tax=Streptomyces sp. NPDC048002 TaxID=3154344 RepID=UPI0033D61776
MFKRVSVRSARTSLPRARAAAVATAALGATVVLGAGVATAAEPAAQTAVTAKTVAAAKAKKAKAVSWTKPVKKYTKTASFHQNGAMWQSTHSGQDFAVATGTQVYAAHGGTVVKAGGNGAGDGPAYGNAIVIKHGNGTYSQYAHLSKIQVKAGQVVKTGQRIALSGNTGNSSGPHLHFEIRKTANYGSAVDPVSFLRAKGLSL